MGRLAGPVLPPRKSKIEQDRRRHDRHAHAAHLEAAPHGGEPVHNTGSGVETKGRAARQHDRVDAIDQCRRTEQLGVAGARRPATHIDRRNRRRLAQDDRRAGHGGRVLGLADEQVGDIGDQIAWTGFGHFFAPRENTLTIRPLISMERNHVHDGHQERRLDHRVG